MVKFSLKSTACHKTENILNIYVCIYIYTHKFTSIYVILIIKIIQYIPDNCFYNL